MRRWIAVAGLAVAWGGAAPRSAARPATKRPPARTARPPGAAVTALVRRHLAGITKRCADPAACAVDPTTVAFATNGVRWTTDDGTGWYGVLFTGFDGDVQLTPHRGLVVTDADANVAWFQVPYTATLTPDPAPDQVSRLAERVGGVAVKRRGGWHLAAVAYTDLVSDHELFTAPPHPDWFDPKDDATLDVKGDRHLARDVFARWFVSGFAAHAGPTARLIASGSSGRELARGAAALKLVRVWDRLGLRPWQIDVEPVAGGELAFAAASVLLPIKKTGHAAPLVLFAVLARHGTAWRWVSLQYGATDR